MIFILLPSSFIFSLILAVEIPAVDRPAVISQAGKNPITLPGQKRAGFRVPERKIPVKHPVLVLLQNFSLE
jgi:hypothetical protein